MYVHLGGVGQLGAGQLRQQWFRVAMAESWPWKYPWVSCFDSSGTT